MWEIHRSGHHVTGVECYEGALQDFNEKYALSLEKFQCVILSIAIRILILSFIALIF